MSANTVPIFLSPKLSSSHRNYRHPAGTIVIPALSRDPVEAESLGLTGFPFMPETSNRWFYWIFTLKNDLNFLNKYHWDLTLILSIEEFLVSSQLLKRGFRFYAQ